MVEERPKYLDLVALDMSTLSDVRMPLWVYERLLTEAGWPL